MTPLIFLDCETTGLQIDKHTVWEIAWVVAHHDRERGLLLVQRRFHSTVRLAARELRDADPDALKIGRFEERYQDEHAMQAAVAMKELTEDCSRIAEGTGQPLPHFVGAVPGFDHNMLCENWLGWPGFGEGHWHYHLIDVETLAAGKLGVNPPYKHSELADMLGVEINPRTRHTAMGDVDVCVGMYAAVYGLEVV